MDECEARSSAEHTNKELKAVLLQNFKAFRSIRKELKGKNVLKGLEFVDQPSPTVHHPLCQFDSRRSIFEELSSILDTLYLGSDVLLPPSTDNISVRCQRKLREAGEHFMEITSNTPLACPVHEAGQFLWNFITEGGDTDNENSLIIAGARPAEDCDTTRERRFKMQVFVRDTKNVLRCVEVIRMFRKYTDENRFVVVGTTRWLLPTEELELEDTYWTVISPSSTTNPTYSSGVQSYYQLQVISAGTMPENEKDVLTHYIGNMARCDAQSMQGALLSTVGLS
ncbi:uncharacterized protein IUM83_02107 [Phytophthora cinnamomi]|uniref:uncharacterized protein n=1 Tax=Phytophthora cinnamomi TaxID=4785 RepID=UPI00355A6F57|nr:hypothetical protein IUM83_02107 [Phytophthora cinnamomi]